jgi:hypothetical protein
MCFGFQENRKFKVVGAIGKMKTLRGSAGVFELSAF